MAEKIGIDATVASKVTDKLREDILSKRIEAGSRITIKEISEKYGTSSTPVREAFRKLEGEHLLSILPYKGAVVLDPGIDFALDVYELNCYLESFIILKAAEEITGEACNELDRINQKMRELIGKEVGERAKYIELNRSFHLYISNFCKNKKAVELYQQQQKLIGTLRSAYVHSSERISMAVAQHEMIIDAMRNKNTDVLRQVADLHSSTAREDFIKQYASKH